jgi:hypothetical protein
LRTAAVGGTRKQGRQTPSPSSLAAAGAIAPADAAADAATAGGASKQQRRKLAADHPARQYYAKLLGVRPAGVMLPPLMHQECLDMQDELEGAAEVINDGLFMVCLGLGGLMAAVRVGVSGVKHAGRALPAARGYAARVQHATAAAAMQPRDQGGGVARGMRPSRTATPPASKAHTRAQWLVRRFCRSQARVGTASALQNLWRRRTPRDRQLKLMMVLLAEIT